MVFPMKIMTDKMTSHLKIKGIIVLMDYFDLINTSRNNIKHNKNNMKLYGCTINDIRTNFRNVCIKAE